MTNFLISQRVRLDPHGVRTDVLEQPLVSLAAGLGLNLIPVSNFVENLPALLDGLEFSGLILSGGGDVSPDCAEGNPGDDWDYWPERDRVEGGLLDAAVSRRIPILCLCRGMQFLNCYFGGRVAAGIHRDHDQKRRPGVNHPVRMIREIHGLAGQYQVNHYHHQGIRAGQVAPPLLPLAVDAEFDVVEALTHRSLPILALQWHPERPSPDDEFNHRLIQGFLAEFAG